MTKADFESLVTHNEKWRHLLTRCSGCGCFTNPEYTTVEHCYDCRCVKGWRLRIFQRYLAKLRWRIENLLFIGWSFTSRYVVKTVDSKTYAGYGQSTPPHKYYSGFSQPRHNWPFAIWRRNARRAIEQAIRWY